MASSVVAVGVAVVVTALVAIRTYDIGVLGLAAEMPVFRVWFPQDMLMVSYFSSLTKANLAIADRIIGVSTV